MESMPNEIILNVVYYILDVKNLSSLSRVSRHFHQLLHNELLYLDAKMCHKALKWASKSGDLDLAGKALGALHRVAQSGNKNCSEATRQFNGSYELFLSVGHGHISIVSLLLERTTVTARSTFDGTSPLVQAAKHGKDDIVRLLLTKYGARVNVRDWRGRSPLWWAADRGYPCVVQALTTSRTLKFNQEDFDLSENALCRASSRGHGDIVLQLLQSGMVDPNSKTTSGKSPLVVAVKFERESIVKLFIHSGLVNVNITDSSGKTALEWACRRGHYGIAKQLVQAGADVSHIHNGMTPISWAAYMFRYDIVSMILELCPDKIGDNQRLLSQAARDGQHRFLQMTKLSAKKTAISRDEN